MIINKIHVIDWYDDIITSITLSESDIYIFNCIQKNFTNDEKLYYCVKIDEESFKQIENILEKKIFTKNNWNFISLILKKYNIRDNVFLLKTKLLSEGLDITLNRINSSELIDIELPYDTSILYSD